MLEPISLYEIALQKEWDTEWSEAVGWEGEGYCTLSEVRGRRREGRDEEGLAIFASWVKGDGDFSDFTYLWFLSFYCSFFFKIKNKFNIII